MTLLTLFRTHGRAEVGTPTVISFPFATLRTVVQYGDQVNEGTLVELVTPVWKRLVEEFQRDPEKMHEVHHRVWEEMIAGWYHSQGARTVLTPASGDRGVDVIAEFGAGSLAFRVIDQVKAYGPNSIVSYETVNAIVGATATDYRGTSKCIVTTTGRFGPGVLGSPAIQALMPGRLYLRDRDQLLEELTGPSGEPEQTA
jgi:restriction system protein